MNHSGFIPLHFRDRTTDVVHRAWFNPAYTLEDVVRDFNDRKLYTDCGERRAGVLTKAPVTCIVCMAEER
jgi:hypothetical protein